MSDSSRHLCSVVCDCVTSGDSSLVNWYPLRLHTRAALQVLFNCHSHSDAKHASGALGFSILLGDISKCRLVETGNNSLDGLHRLQRGHENSVIIIFYLKGETDEFIYIISVFCFHTFTATLSFLKTGLLVMLTRPMLMDRVFFRL